MLTEDAKKLKKKKLSAIQHMIATDYLQPPKEKPALHGTAVGSSHIDTATTKRKYISKKYKAKPKKKTAKRKT